MPKIDTSNVAELLRQNGSLHLQAYLLRLLDVHRPDDPLSFLHSVLHRSYGGMTLSLSMLAEFVSSTQAFPRAALIRTIVFSTRDITLDLDDPLHRRVVLDAAALITRSMGEELLPTTEELNALDASGAAHFIVSLAKSRSRVVRRIGSPPPTTGDGAGVSSGSHRLKLIIELDATTPAATRSAIELIRPSGKNQPLLARVAAEVAWLTLSQPQKCRVVVAVVASRQSQVLDAASPAGRLVGFVKEAVQQIEPASLRDAFIVITGDASAFLFPALVGSELLSSSVVSRADPDVLTLWLREPKLHSYYFLQAGHFVEPLAASAGPVVALPESASLQQMVFQRRNLSTSPPQTLSPPLVPSSVSRSALLLTHLIHSMLGMAMPQDGSSVTSFATSMIILRQSAVDSLSKLKPSSIPTAASPVTVVIRLLVHTRLELHKGTKILLHDKNEPSAASSAVNASSVPCCYMLAGQGAVLPPHHIPVASPADEVAALQEAAAIIRAECIPEASQDSISFPWERVWSVLTVVSWHDLVVGDSLSQLCAHPAVAKASEGAGVVNELDQRMQEPCCLTMQRHHVVQYQGDEPPGLAGSTTSIQLSPSYIAEKPFWVAHLPPPTPPKAMPVDKKKNADAPNK